MTLVAALFGRRDQRRDKPPFRVRQIARIPSAPLVAPAIFDRPHRRPPNQAASLESQTIPPNQDVLGQTLNRRIVLSIFRRQQRLSPSSFAKGGQPTRPELLMMLGLTSTYSHRDPF